MTSNQAKDLGEAIKALTSEINSRKTKRTQMENHNMALDESSPIDVALDRIVELEEEINELQNALEKATGIIEGLEDSVEYFKSRVSELEF